MLHWPAAIDEALRQSRCFVMEMTLEADSFFTLGGAMLFTDGHDMAGPTGLVQQLTDRGYRLTPVTRPTNEETASISMGM